MKGIGTWIAGAITGALIATALLAGECRAAPLTPQQARDIYIVAYGQFTGPPAWLEQMPVIHIVSQEVLCETAEMKPECNVLGLYREANVYILDTLNFETLSAASVLLHEYIHHFQYLKSGSAYDCETWLAYEQQAYAIQVQVLQKAGDYLAARSVRIAAYRLPKC